MYDWGEGGGGTYQNPVKFNVFDRNFFLIA